MSISRYHRVKYTDQIRSNQNQSMSATVEVLSTREKKRSRRDSLMIFSGSSASASDEVGFMGHFRCFPASKNVMSVVVSERVPLLNVVNWQSTALRVPYVSRIEMRLLRDTRRVLEYLSKEGFGQPCACKKMRR